jgi:hypothetical protein
MEHIIIDSRVVTPDDSEIISLAENQISLEEQVKELEHQLKEAQERLHLVSEQLLPNAMAKAGMKEFKMANGLQITIKEDVYASIRKDFINQAVEWLDQHQLGDIVREDVTVKFGRGQQATATKLFEYCRANGFNAENKLAVHPQTLKTTVEEQIAKGIQFPDEFFEIMSNRRAIIDLE